MAERHREPPPGEHAVNEPRVDVIIPVHTATRPIARAVASVLVDSVAPIRVNVVCHRISPEAIKLALGSWAQSPQVRFLSIDDGVPSPAGPINYGYSQATAEFTTLLDSDDEYEPGAIDAWLAVQRRDDADVVIAPLRHSDGRSPRTPPTRPFRSRTLDGVRDRLAYRTRQHGLVRTARFPDLAMSSGLRTGEDVVQGATLWYSSARISYARSAPAYVIHADADNRASTSTKPAAESLRFLDAIISGPLRDTLTARQKESLTVKILRTHVIDVLRACLRDGLSEPDLVALSDSVQRLNEFSPGAMRVLSRRESRVIGALANTPELDRLEAELERLYDFWRPSNLMSASMNVSLHREAPLRLLAAFAFAR